MTKTKSICVYCASSDRIEACYSHAATELGELLAHRKIRCVCGAGNKGLMADITDAVLANGGEVWGIIPQFMVDKGLCHTRLTRVIKTDTMHHRKDLMMQHADAVIALPGGYGTMEELLEIITWKQLGLFHGSIVVLNTSGFYDPLIAQLTRGVEQGFIHPLHQAIWQVATTPQEALSLIDNSTLTPHPLVDNPVL